MHHCRASLKILDVEFGLLESIEIVINPGLEGSPGALKIYHYNKRGRAISFFSDNTIVIEGQQGQQGQRFTNGKMKLKAIPFCEGEANGLINTVFSFENESHERVIVKFSGTLQERGLTPPAAAFKNWSGYSRQPWLENHMRLEAQLMALMYPGQGVRFIKIPGKAIGLVMPDLGPTLRSRIETASVEHGTVVASASGEAGGSADESKVLGHDDRDEEAGLPVSPSIAPDLLQAGFSAQVMHFFASLLIETMYFHLRYGIHADIKPGNICLRQLSGSSEYQAGLIDFGSAMRTSSGAVRFPVGSRELFSETPYLAPELFPFRPGIKSLFSDIWSLAVVGFEYFFHVAWHPWFESADIKQLYRTNIIAFRFAMIRKLNALTRENLSPGLKDLLSDEDLALLLWSLKKMMKLKPRRRASPVEILRRLKTRSSSEFSGSLDDLLLARFKEAFPSDSDMPTPGRILAACQQRYASARAFLFDVNRERYAWITAGAVTPPLLGLGAYLGFDRSPVPPFPRMVNNISSKLSVAYMPAVVILLLLLSGVIYLSIMVIGCRAPCRAVGDGVRGVCTRRPAAVDSEAEPTAAEGDEPEEKREARVAVVFGADELGGSEEALHSTGGSTSSTPYVRLGGGGGGGGRISPPADRIVRSESGTEYTRL